MAYREKAHVPPEPEDHPKVRTSIEDAQRHAKNAVRWARISVAFATLAVLANLLHLALKYGWW